MIDRRTMRIGVGMALVAAAHVGVADVVDFVPVAASLDRVTLIVATPNLPDRVFVGEQPGRIRVIRDGVLQAGAWLDITDRVNAVGFEQGLTGLALPPGFPANPYVYVHYIRADSASVVARFRRLAGPLDGIDASSEQTVLTLAQPHPTHNCNQLVFGPDGFLYIGCGDGGPPFTPVHDPQSLTHWYGKILRIDVDNVPTGQSYSIPAGNPFVGVAGAAPEVWAYGLRNPYRFSFDALDGDLWIADVGQSTWEEIDRLPAAMPAGANLGWNRMEGTHCYPPGSGCDMTGLVLPEIEYDHADGRCAVIGGLRMRYAASTTLEGAYVHADFCTRELTAERAIVPAGWHGVRLGIAPQMPTALGVDAGGRLYVGSYGIGTATVHRVDVVDSLFADDFEAAAAARAKH